MLWRQRCRQTPEVLASWYKKTRTKHALQGRQEGLLRGRDAPRRPGQLRLGSLLLASLLRPALALLRGAALGEEHGGIQHARCALLALQGVQDVCAERRPHQGPQPPNAEGAKDIVFSTAQCHNRVRGGAASLPHLGSPHEPNREASCRCGLTKLEVCWGRARVLGRPALQGNVAQ